MSIIAKQFERKDNVSLGRFLKEVENETEKSIEILKESYLRRGNAHIVGVTGPPGAGKSTLVGKMVKTLTGQNLSVGVVCIDPTSPFTQGALLGDRIRMQDIANNPKVFIKSLATRGNLGGLAASTADIVSVLDAFGKEIIIVETVGVGQVEFDVMKIADTVVLVNVPGLGDSLQTYKGGIMEVADIFVINQADRPGAKESVRDLKMMVHESDEEDWLRPVLKTVATEGKGVEKLIGKINEHKSYLMKSEKWRIMREERNVSKLYNMVEQMLISYAKEIIYSDKYKNELDKVKQGLVDPISVSYQIVNNLVEYK